MKTKTTDKNWFELVVDDECSCLVVVGVTVNNAQITHSQAFSLSLAIPTHWLKPVLCIHVTTTQPILCKEAESVSSNAVLHQVPNTSVFL